ncbi:MAG: hypothetical protein U1E97_04800 [Alphaproteobacteria bacterium]
MAGEAAGAPSAVLRTTYVLPARYRLPDAPVKGSEITSVAAAEPGTAEPLWMTVWRARAVEIVVVCLAIVGVTAIFVFQDALVRRRRLYRWVRVGFMLFTLLALGWYAGAQLSVLNVLTFGDALRSGFRWEVFSRRICCSFCGELWRSGFFFTRAAYSAAGCVRLARCRN